MEHVSNRLKTKSISSITLNWHQIAFKQNECDQYQLELQKFENLNDDKDQWRFLFVKEDKTFLTSFGFIQFDIYIDFYFISLCVPLHLVPGIYVLYHHYIGILYADTIRGKPKENEEVKEFKIFYICSFVLLLPRQ